MVNFMIQNSGDNNEDACIEAEMSKGTEARNCRGHSLPPSSEGNSAYLSLGRLFPSTLSVLQASPKCSFLYVFPERRAFIPTSQILAMNYLLKDPWLKEALGWPTWHAQIWLALLWPGVSVLAVVGLW